MKKIISLFCFALATLLPAAEPPANAAAKTEPAADPETVLVTYRATPGKEAALLDAVKRQWQTLRRMHLVTDAPHTIVRGKESGGETYFVEVFTWASASIPDHAPAEVLAIWGEFNQLCQARGGHPALEIAEVDRVDARD